MLTNKKILLSIGLGLLAILFAFIIFQTNKNFLNKNSTQTATPTPTETQTEIMASLFYPMKNYNNRVTQKWYGKYANGEVIKCGKGFVGYHNADDLEVTDEEIIEEVPVYSISDATVMEVVNVGGYGGLVVTKNIIQDANYTVYYGHVDISSTKIKIGDTVSKGQVIANLGSECSIETDGERKHLHFSVRKGDSEDVRGYVNTQNELAQWVNPKEFLSSLNAAEPK